MTSIPESASKIARKLITDEKKIEESLEQMAREGLLFRVPGPETPLYMQPNFIMGIYEWHVNAVDREIAQYADHVYDGLFKHHWIKRKTKQLRVVPVDQSIDHKDTVRGYDVIRELVRGSGNGPYAVAPCVCRVRGSGEKRQ